ncbi:MAG: adenylate/guanylate cyclase domain-containing response regulator [Chlamydiota bacterium]
MAQDSNPDILAHLEKIREKIDQLAGSLLRALAPFVSDEKQASVAEFRSDIDKVHQGCLLLKLKNAEFLERGALVQNSHGLEFVQYLTKARHDLRNCVNVINGYAEMVLEDLREKKDPAADAFLEMGSQIAQILGLIDAIKSPESQRSQGIPADVDVHISVEQGSESAEYRDFKAKFSILIVDDNEESCTILKRYLTRNGYQNAQIVPSGPAALDLLKKQHVDLVLLDIDMPQMTGIEVLQRLKEDIICQRLMVLMISAVDTLENTIACIRLGAEDFLPKPFNADLLRVRIGSCIEKKWFIKNEKSYLERIEFEKQRYENLMRAVFPSVIVNELTETGTVKPMTYSNVTIMFADIVGFTAYCDKHQPAEILQNLQDFADMCESVAIQHHLQKIKTIGDCFLATSGLLLKSDNPVLDSLRCAKDLLVGCAKLPPQWQLRIGIHFGSVIGGIVGHRQYQFDIWGDVVNTASRIQSQAVPGTICLSKQAWEKLQGLCECKSLGLRPVRGKEPIELFEYVSGG